MKDTIVDCLGRSGWQKDRIVDAFSKTFETVGAEAGQHLVEFRSGGQSMVAHQR